MSLVWGEEDVLTQSEVIASYIELLLVEDLERQSKVLVAKEQGKILLQCTGELDWWVDQLRRKCVEIQAV